MKIGVVIEKLYSGGTQKVAILEVANFRKLGLNADLLVLKRSKEIGFSDLLKSKKIEPIYISDYIPKYLDFNFKIPFFAFFSLFHITYPFLIKIFVKKFNYDLYIAHGTYTTYSVFSLANKKEKVISFVHDPISYILGAKYKNKVIGKLGFLLIPLAKYLDKVIINNSYKVLTYTDEFKTLLNSILPTNKVELIMDAIETKSENEISLEKKNYAIAVTKWDSGKNISMLLDIWKKGEMEILLYIIGKFEPEKLQKDVQEKINGAELKEKIKIIGKVSEKELNDYYKNAKFLVHPCTEAFGMTILESASYGCPSVFVKTSGVSSLFGKMELEYQPENENTDEYLKSIDYIQNLKNTEYKKLAMEFYKSASKTSYEKHCNQILKLI
ncbi:glycosyltransferase [Patescibacteria group bacterium]|nr:glycosyltransferase [Patescibacteria group bacterium]